MSNKLIKKAKSEVFKLQKPIEGNIPMDLVLIYNKSRKYYGQVKMTDEMKELFGDEYKIYVFGNVGDDGMLHISHKVPTPRPFW